MTEPLPKFGFSEFTTWPWSFRRDLEEFRNAGADVIEICEFKLPHEDYGDELNLLRKHHLTPASIQANVHSIFPDSMAPEPKDPADRIAAFKRAIDLSAPYLPDETPFIAITGIAPEKNIRHALEKTVEALKDLGEHAARRKMKIAFEPLNPVTMHTDTALWGLDHGIELVERVGHPNVGICIDTWNIWETPLLPEVIRQCGDRIVLVQMSDWQTPRSTADRFSLGDGAIPLASIMRSIRSTGYDGPWVVEILSSLHLPGSLWKSDMTAMLEANRKTFECLWSESRP